MPIDVSSRTGVLGLLRETLARRAPVHAVRRLLGTRRLEEFSREGIDVSSRNRFRFRGLVVVAEEPVPSVTFSRATLTLRARSANTKGNVAFEASDTNR